MFYIRKYFYLLTISFLIYLLVLSSFYISKNSWLSVLFFVIISYLADILFIRNQYKLYELLFILFFPIVFSVLYFINEIDFYSRYSNPLIFVTIFLILRITVLKNIYRPIPFLLIANYIIIYSFFVLNFWHTNDNKNSPEIKNYEYSNYKEIDFYKFMDYKMDTISIKPTNTFTLIVTTNEYCLPCRAAYYDLNKILDSKKNILKTYYVYVSNKSNFSEIIYNTYIEDKSKILYDISDNFYNDINIKSYPIFFFYKKEKLIKIIEGHNSIAIKNTINSLENNF